MENLNSSTAQYRDQDQNFCELIEAMGGREAFQPWDSYLENVADGSQILLVEDEKDIRESLKLILEIEGYDVASACNGVDALDILNKGFKPAIILLDLMMPVMDGAEFAKVLSKDPVYSSIPLILLTAFPDKTLGIPAADVFRKPLDINLLFTKLQATCAHH